MSNAISQWLNRSYLASIPKKYLVYIKERDITIKYGNPPDTLVTGKSGWVSLLTDNIQTVRYAMRDFNDAAVKNSTIIKISSKLQMNPKQFMKAMPKELSQKLVKLKDDSPESISFTFVDLDDNWEPDESLLCKDFIISNLSKLQKEKFKEQEDIQLLELQPQPPPELQQEEKQKQK
ncbi:hypothetical protein DDB_G0273115 [Dictyostelium discoideum AX4]|uniref:Uncharacterized protein n=1 Tax=Dictyostelium discoideum TaxID=44689 RepID=Q556S6_DICDI|nr:hypothetical protein DDB_G0273853 [Dictyostelium discoideum AX4]XP_644707.1 hypothetical protein DDB_G0273115 [Dictyostelium discoideum AX4]EAL70617.1 hypothetical protein DDB_G0273853 [Dictyostelium discoideum AX4]EAL70775.1 hypothetical protein DDB_G0273115 [Dictyostelium discoideum AX4]|eukprot:XP_644543.1 hypothetical protein DDB_G0273853 [Dictyostelium discoideum AX4]